MQDIYIYGCGGVGDEIAEHLLNSDEYNVCGFIDDNPEIRQCMGLKSWTLDEILEIKSPATISVIISIGEPAIRSAVSNKVSSHGIREASIDLSRHYNPDYSSIGEGTLLHDNAYVSVNVNIGKSCLINKSTIVGHDCVIGDYCVISPHVTLGGNVSVGENTYIGTGALIRNGLTIGKNVIIGMGSVVVKNVEDNAVVVGNPAKFLRENENRRVFKHS